jgi:hypothetical protein
MRRKEKEKNKQQLERIVREILHDEVLSASKPTEEASTFRWAHLHPKGIGIPESGFKEGNGRKTKKVSHETKEITSKADQLVMELQLYTWWVNF